MTPLSHLWSRNAGRSERERSTGNVTRRSSALVLVVLFAAVALFPAATAAGATGSASATDVANSSTNATITDVTVTGEGTFRHNESVAAWESARPTVNVTITRTGIDEPDYYDVCFARLQGSNRHNYGCNNVLIGPGTTTVHYTIPNQTNTTASVYRLHVTAMNTLKNPPQQEDEATVPVSFLDPKADLDLDRLSNRKERKRGLNMTNSDVDEDGLSDGNEIKQYGTDPTKKDTDEDGLLDGVEVSGPTNATNPDTDGDGLEDGREQALSANFTDPDTDDDGLRDGREVQLDADPTDPDTDDDGVRDGREAELGTDPNDSDTDGDGLSDGLEVAIGTNPTSFFTVVFALLGGLLVTAAGVGLWQQSDHDLDELRGPFSRVHFEFDTAVEGESTTDSNLEDEPEVTSDAELLPPDKRIEQLLYENGGRMRQSGIVETTDWSKAKVSRTLSEMEDEDAISRVQLGRENIVTVPDYEFDEEISPDS